jgi:hypothetical protein
MTPRQKAAEKRERNVERRTADAAGLARRLAVRKEKGRQHSRDRRQAQKLGMRVAEFRQPITRAEPPDPAW